MNNKFDPSNHDQNHVYDLNNLSNVSEVFQEYYRQQEEDRRKESNTASAVQGNNQFENKNINQVIVSLVVFVLFFSFLPFIFNNKFLLNFKSSESSDDSFKEINFSFDLTENNPEAILKEHHWIYEPEDFDTYIDCVTYVSPKSIMGTTYFFNDGANIYEQHGFYYMDSNTTEYYLVLDNLICEDNVACDVFFDPNNKITFKAIVNENPYATEYDLKYFLSSIDYDKDQCVVHYK